jgi:hypothetical protein
MSEAPAGRRLCVFGDLIRDGTGWAGVAHTVEAAVAAVGEGWTVTAATRVGTDDMEAARDALSRLGAVEMEDRIARGGSTPHLDPETGAVRDRGGAWPVDVLRTVITGRTRSTWPSPAAPSWTPKGWRRCPRSRRTFRSS